ncbi:hypothetical protein JNUCC74_01840 [Cerasibacillus sp. JNUCC 74]
MKKSSKKLATLGLATILLLTSGGLISAGTSYESYNVDVPRMNGSANTNNQTKSKTDARADLKVSTLGKALDARVRSSDGGTGKWVRVSTTGTFTLPNSVKKGKKAHVQFSNDLSTIVNVRVAGSWRSN